VAERVIGWLRWSERVRRRAAVVGVLVAAVVVWIVVAAVSPVPGISLLGHLAVLGGAGWCDEQPLACTVSKSALSALALAVLGLAGFFWWRRGALSKYRRSARDRPEDLFDWLPRGLAPPRILGRDAFIAMILANLRGNLLGAARAQVIR
jgi:hypothetical protein